MDAYDRSIENLIGNQEKVGPDISDKIGRVLERCINPILDDKAAKEKRDLFPCPGNISNLKVPKLNNLIYKKIAQEKQWVDHHSLQQTQSFLIEGLTAVAYEAEQALKLRAWFSALKEDEKEELPPSLARLGKGYVALMDATLLFTKTVGDITSLRRKLVRNNLVEPYKSLFDDEKSPATATWLVGDDVNGAIRKAKDTASLADKITGKNPWPSAGRKRFHSNERRNSQAEVRLTLGLMTGARNKMDTDSQEELEEGEPLEVAGVTITEKNIVGIFTGGIPVSSGECPSSLF